CTPHGSVLELAQWHFVRGVAAGRAVLRPFGYHRDLLLAQRRVTLVVLNAIVALHIVRRHGATLVLEPGLIHDQARIGQDFIVGHQRHGAGAPDMVTVGALFL